MNKRASLLKRLYAILSEQADDELVRKWIANASRSNFRPRRNSTYRSGPTAAASLKLQHDTRNATRRANYLLGHFPDMPKTQRDGLVWGEILKTGASTSYGSNLKPISYTTKRLKNTASKRAGSVLGRITNYLRQLRKSGQRV